MNYCKQCQANVEMLTGGPAFHFDARFPGRGIVCTPEGYRPIVVTSEFQRGVEAMRKAAAAACRDVLIRESADRPDSSTNTHRAAAGLAAQECADVIGALVVLP